MSHRHLIFHFACVCVCVYKWMCASASQSLLLLLSESRSFMHFFSFYLRADSFFFLCKLNKVMVITQQNLTLLFHLMSLTHHLTTAKLLSLSILWEYKDFGNIDSTFIRSPNQTTPHFLLFHRLNFTVCNLNWNHLTLVGVFPSGRLVPEHSCLAARGMHSDSRKGSGCTVWDVVGNINVAWHTPPSGIRETVTHSHTPDAAALCCL